MKFFAFIARDGPDGLSIRLAKKQEHKAHLDACGFGLRVLQSGPLLDEQGRERGSLIMFEAQSRELVERFVDSDPYVRANLFREITLDEWAWRRGNPYL